MGLEIKDENFKEVIAENDYVLIDFWAEWCGPCRMISPIVDQLAEENKDLIVGKINVDSNPKAAIEFGITSIPTLLFFKKGELMDRVKGVLPKSGIQKKINSLIND